LRQPVFYSFHFGNDVMRVQQVRQMGAIEGNPAVSANEWETIKRKHRGVEDWIDANMAYKRCVIVLIGSDTHARPWVKYEIQKASAEGRGLFGINIHNLKCPNNGIGVKGKNPFEGLGLTRDGRAFVPPVYDPAPQDAYGEISRNLSAWVDRAIAK